MRKYLIFMIAVSILSGCSHLSPVVEAEIPQASEEPEIVETDDLLNEDGMTILERYNTPEGYTRVGVEENSFAEFLRNQNLKPYGEKVLYYDGREKNRDDVYDSVFDVDIGNRDLHQCADAVLLLRGEYLYSQQLYEDINFHFVSGFKAEYSKWREGYRIKVDGNSVSYYSGADPSSSYESFRKYMDMVFAYSGTLSLEKELSPIDVDEMQIGDVFIKGGSPGHAVIVVDMASNKDNEMIFILAQSYMPAQQTQILINPTNEGISPWYTLDEVDTLKTPEWKFELDQLRRWIDG